MRLILCYHFPDWASELLDLLSPGKQVFLLIESGEREIETYFSKCWKKENIIMTVFPL